MKLLAQWAFLASPYIWYACKEGTDSQSEKQTFTVTTVT